MKKIIAIVTIGASTAFLQVQAQEAPQTERTQDGMTQRMPDTQTEEGVAEEKVEIEKSALPKEVTDSFENSEYSNMDIVAVYEVNSSGSESAQHQPVEDGTGQVQDTIPGESAQLTDSASTQLEEAANQTDQAVDVAATGMEQDAENVANETETAASDVSQDAQEEASDFAQNTEQAATDVAQETQEEVNNAAMETEGLIEDKSQAVGDTAINEAQGGDRMKEPEGSATEPKQPIDSASLGVSQQGDETVVEMSEDVAKQTEGAITETETTEDMEDTGKVMSAEAPEEVDEASTQPTTAEAEQKGKELYDNNQYDNYTEANSSAYQEIAEDEIAKSGEKSKKYELQVKDDEGNVTLTYDENGELVKADKGSM